MERSVAARNSVEQRLIELLGKEACRQIKSYLAKTYKVEPTQLFQQSELLKKGLLEVFGDGAEGILHHIEKSEEGSSR